MLHPFGNMGRLTSEGKAPGDLALHHLPGQVLTELDLEGEHWYDCAPIWPEASSGGPKGTMSKWIEVAGDALSSSSRMYEKRVRSSSGEAMKRALGKEKTVSDKIAAVTLLVQESPVHRLDELRTLLTFANKKGRRERGPAIDALKDLFINNLLPDNRRLIPIGDREFHCGKGKISKRHLAYALFESEIKTAYREFLHMLEESGNDTLAFFKQKVVKVISDLLVGKPENEKELLSMLVNKLGDPDRKVSSIASYKLLQLIEKHHPQMRLIVVGEVEQLLTRPNVTRKTQYYSISFLNQIRFSEHDVELARKFVRIYMDLFTTCLAEEKRLEEHPLEKKGNVKKKGLRKNRKFKKASPVRMERNVEVKETRLMAALLIGVNRAFPYTKPEEDDSSYQNYYNALFHVAHAKSLGPATNALAFLFQVSQSNSTQSDRFYRTLYSRVYDVAGAGETKQAAFLNLLFKALKSDTNNKRTKAFTKRLFQAGLYGTSGFAGACTILISELAAGKDIGMLKSFVSIAENDDDEEHFHDVEETSTVGDAVKDEMGSEGCRDVDNHNADESDEINSISEGYSHEKEVPFPAATSVGPYDPRKRDPRYAGAEKSSLWEAVCLCSHYHPSVSKFASSICTHLEKISYSGDPLKDFSEIAFLDRFSYKKAKNRVAESLYGTRASRYRDDPVANSPQFLELVKSGKVAEDDGFFAKFFGANPDRVLKDKDIIEENGEKTKSFDVDSEEEAFENAMQLEMRRLAADEGFSSNGINGNFGDIDEADEDELRAFDEAFGMDMVERDGENDKTEEEMILHSTSLTEGNGSDSGGDDQDDDLVADFSEQNKTQNNGSSIFAPVEDYEEAIAKDIAIRRDGEDVDGVVLKRPRGNTAVSDKRKGVKTSNRGSSFPAGVSTRKEEGTQRKLKELSKRSTKIENGSVKRKRRNAEAEVKKRSSKKKRSR